MVRRWRGGGAWTMILPAIHTKRKGKSTGAVRAGPGAGARQISRLLPGSQLNLAKGV
jgi:hypothetical protein